MESSIDLNSSVPVEKPAAGNSQPSTPTCSCKRQDYEYRKCMKNQAAAVGAFAVDGCGEFMPSDPERSICAACSCHRSYHQRERVYVSRSASPEPVYSPSPISIRFPPNAAVAMQASQATSFDQQQKKKRFRTKFTPLQKKMMQEFAEGVEWKLRNAKEDNVSDFCKQIGVERRVFKVWMHNNNYTLGPKAAARLNGNPTGDNSGDNGVGASDEDKKSTPSSSGN